MNHFSDGTLVTASVGFFTVSVAARGDVAASGRAVAEVAVLNRTVGLIGEAVLVKVRVVVVLAVDGANGNVRGLVAAVDVVVVVEEELTVGRDIGALKNSDNQ